MKAKKMICTLVAFVMTITLCACSGAGASVGAYTGNPEILEIIQNVGAGDYTTPKAVFAELKDNLLSRSFGSLITQINGYAGGNFIMYEEFTCGSVEEVKEFFSEFGAEVAEIELN